MIDTPVYQTLNHKEITMSIRLALFIAFLIFCSVAAARQPATYSEAKRLFDAQPRNPKTDAYGSSWANFNNANKLDEKDGCYFKANGETSQILVIDKAGVVVSYFADPENGRSQCWRKTYMGVKFPRPPFAPYYHYLVMH
jgi:hypothetical protein